MSETNDKARECAEDEHDWDENLMYSGFQFRRCRKCKRLEGYGFDNRWSLVRFGIDAERRKETNG